MKSFDLAVQITIERVWQKALNRFKDEPLVQMTISE